MWGRWSRGGGAGGAVESCEKIGNFREISLKELCHYKRRVVTKNRNPPF